MSSSLEIISKLSPIVLVSYDLVPILQIRGKRTVDSENIVSRYQKENPVSCNYELP